MLCGVGSILITHQAPISAASVVGPTRSFGPTLPAVSVFIPAGVCYLGRSRRTGQLLAAALLTQLRH